jgi:hypothetical protein
MGTGAPDLSRGRYQTCMVMRRILVPYRARSCAPITARF